MKTTIQILRELREDRDLTQNDVARSIGTTQQHYSKYENGIYELPLRYFYKLAKLYDVSADYLLGRTDYIEKQSFENLYVTKDYSCSKLLKRILRLNEFDRQAVIDYVELLNIKESQKQ